MIPVSKALDIIARETRPLGSERVALADAVGRVLREDIIADTDLPPFDRSQMDGFALVASDTIKAPVTLKVVGESAAGKGLHKIMNRGEAVRIMTGAPVPTGADSVQKVELTSEISALLRSGGANGTDQFVEITASTEKGRSIVRKGSEVRKGTTVFKAGEIVTENMVATLASFGYAKVTAGKRPRVAILGTGSEVVEINKKPGRDQIRNSNSVMLDVFCRRAGATTRIQPMIKDEIAVLKTGIKMAARNSDIVVITGGVSVGKYDHTKTALSDLEADIFFEKVRLRPGKPAVFARLGKTLIFGLPGNPVSAAVTFHLFVRKAILAMQGAETTDLKKGTAIAASDAKAARERDTYLPAKLSTDKVGHLIADPLKWQGSSDFIGFSQADSLIFVPRGGQLSKGQVAEIVFL